jgi:cyanuric acid amidohydrolase
MVHVTILKFPISSPADTSPLDRLKAIGTETDDILAVVGKTEGNGCVNDFSRTLASAVWTPLLPKTAITIFSGGTEGVLSPHVTFVLRHHEYTGLMAEVMHTERIEPHNLGTLLQAEQVERATRRAQAAMRSNVADGSELCTNLVLVKCPLLTSTQIERLRMGGMPLRTTDTYESMAISRHASALGVAWALGEAASPDLRGFVQGRDIEAIRAKKLDEVACSRASCSSGAELDDCHILVLATSVNDPRYAVQKAISGVMEDAIDAKSVMALLKQIEDEEGEVIQVFAKAEADPRGHIRDQRHTMNTDSDIHSTRHARAAVGGLLAGLVGDTEIYVSGGAEGQGPPGGGSLCIVYAVGL